MILSDAGIQEAIKQGQLEISPTPQLDQYTTSAVDLFLADGFHGWDQSKFTIPGVTVSLNLAEQRYGATAAGYLKPLSIERDGSFILPPYHESPRPVLAMTRERVHLKPGSRLAARVEGRSSLARIGLMVHLTAPIIHANSTHR
jgi:dCTP deaminase